MKTFVKTILTTATCLSLVSCGTGSSDSDTLGGKSSGGGIADEHEFGVISSLSVDEQVNNIYQTLASVEKVGENNVVNHNQCIVSVKYRTLENAKPFELTAGIVLTVSGPHAQVGTSSPSMASWSVSKINGQDISSDIVSIDLTTFKSLGYYSENGKKTIKSQMIEDFKFCFENYLNLEKL